MAAPLVKEATPLVKEATPLATEATPLVTEATPLVKEAVPLVKEAVPLVKDTPKQTSDIVDAASTQMAVLPVQQLKSRKNKRRKSKNTITGLEIEKKQKLDDVEKITKKDNENVTSGTNQCESLLIAASKLAGEQVPSELDSFKFTHSIDVVHTCLTEATLAISLLSTTMFPKP